MSLSFKSAPVQAFTNRDQTYFVSYPFPGPGNSSHDPGEGGGGSELIVVKQGGVYKPAYRSSLVPGTLPAGDYPAQPTLTGSEDWWPCGLHGYGRVSWSPNFGVVISGVTGLAPDGVVRTVNASFVYWDMSNLNQQNRWRYIAPFWGTGGELSGGSYLPNSWTCHFGYDHALKSDLVYRFDERRIYRISGAWPGQASLGAAVFTLTGAQESAGYILDVGGYNGNGGMERVGIPWRNEWWILQCPQSAVLTQRLWGFNTGTGVLFDITLPAGVTSRFGGSGQYPGNLCLSVDPLSQRVIAAQADTTQTPITENGTSKWPLILWEVDAAARTFTPIWFTNPPNVICADKNNGINLFTWAGGFRHIYWDTYTLSNVVWPAVVGSRSQGGSKPRQIYIAKNGAPRNITFSSQTITQNAPDLYLRQKHTEYAYRPSDGRVYCHGGDQERPSSGDGNQSIWSFVPDNFEATWREDQSKTFTGKPIRPANIDENGWQVRADEFWMMPGYPYPTTINFGGNLRHGDYAAASDMNVGEWATATGGTSNQFWKWNQGTNLWTTYPIDPASGETGPFGNETVGGTKLNSSQQLRWYYDSAADRMAIASYGGSVLLQAPCVKMVEFVAGIPKYRVFKANRLTNGSATLPDGRVTPNPLWREDRAGIDSTTGYLYNWNATNGDLFRIQTWTAPGNYAYPTYIEPGSGHTMLPVEWCCKLPTTTETGNAVFFLPINGVCWIVTITASGRARVYSWAPGDAHAWEHDTPAGMFCTAAFVYEAGGVKKIMLLGGVYVYQQGAIGAANWNKVWTGMIS